MSEAEALVTSAGFQYGRFSGVVYLIRPPSGIASFHIFLFLDPIEVLMQRIQKERQELL